MRKKSTLLRFGSYEPSSGLWGMLLVMLNQRSVFKSEKYKNKQALIHE